MKGDLGVGSSNPTSNPPPCLADGNNNYQGWKLMSKLQRLHMNNKQHSETSQQTISLNRVLPNFPENDLTKQGGDFSVIDLIQDLNGVVNHHALKSDFIAHLLASNGGRVPHPTELSDVNPVACIDEVLKTLHLMKSYINNGTLHTEALANDANTGNVMEEPQHEGEEAPYHAAGPHDNPVPNILGEANQFVDVEMGFEEEYGEFPTPEQHGELAWPACVGTTGFRSLLCTTCAPTVPPLWKTQLEMADFCITPHSEINSSSMETLYKDGWELATIDRQSFSSFEPVRPIASPVVAAWCRLLNTNWKAATHPVLCMHLVNKDDLAMEGDQILEVWHNWLVACKVEFQSAEIVFIPYRESGRYGLLIANFRENKFQQVYCSSQEFGDFPLDGIVSSIGAYFCEFLLRIGDPRFISVQDFPFEVLTPHWCLTTNDNDSGLIAMHVMEVYSGIKHELLHLPLHQAVFRLRKRVTICSRIASSPLNLLKTEIMQGLVTNILTKVAKHVSQPT